jgi:hypothetical protein
MGERMKTYFFPICLPSNYIPSAFLPPFQLPILFWLWFCLLSLSLVFSICYWDTWICYEFSLMDHMISLYSNKLINYSMYCKMYFICININGKNDNNEQKWSKQLHVPKKGRLAWTVDGRQACSTDSVGGRQSTHNTCVHSFPDPSTDLNTNIKLHNKSCSAFLTWREKSITIYPEYILVYL